MRRFGLLVSFSLVLLGYGCGSSGSGGTGGSVGATGTGGVPGSGATGGSTGTGGAGAKGGSMGTGASAGTNGNAGAGGNASGGTGGGSAGTNGSAGANAAAGTNGGAGNAGATGNGATGGATACGDGTGSGDTCNTITGSATGPCVVTTMLSDTAPPPQGGTVSNGTYALTGSFFYGTLPDGAASDSGDFGTRRETLIVSLATTTSFTLEQFQTDGTENSSSQGTVTISGTTVTYTQTCPATGDGGNNGGSSGYTSSGTTFALIMSKGSGILVKIYTKSS